MIISSGHCTVDDNNPSHKVMLRRGPRRPACTVVSAVSHLKSPENKKTDHKFCIALKDRNKNRQKKGSHTGKSFRKGGQKNTHDVCFLPFFPVILHHYTNVEIHHRIKCEIKYLKRTETGQK